MIVCLSVRHNFLNTVPLKPLACFLQFADTVPLFTLLSLMRRQVRSIFKLILSDVH